MKNSNLKVFRILIILFFTIFIFSPKILYASDSPKSIGLTLSGGGAKGFAHIGILHVIDSLGLKVDYISGTSMGSIVGGLYAAGYSADEIEKLSLEVDWSSVFSARPALKSIHIRNRKDAEKSIIEVPFEKRKLIVGSGAIEGQKLWTLLENLFYSSREVTDFSKMSIPFACVATDMETGTPVVMKTGDIVTAIRASMSVPAVFSMVNREKKWLVDGGVVNNFPVDVVRDLGAEYVIGVNVSTGLKKADELRTPVDVIYQMGFFKDLEMYPLNREVTDLYIEPDISSYEATSFTAVKEIIEIGKRTARQYIAQIRDLAVTNPIKEARLPVQHLPLVISDLKIVGLRNVSENLVRDIISIDSNDTVNIEDINNVILKLYATSYFKRINYNYSSVTNDVDINLKRLIFEFDEEPMSYVKFGLHYNTFIGVGIIGGFSTRKLFSTNISADLSIRLGPLSAYKASASFFISKNQKNWVNLDIGGDELAFSHNSDFKSIAFYKQNFNRIQASINTQVSNNSYLSLGVANYSQKLYPELNSDYAIKGRTVGSELFLGFQKYTLDRHEYARKGQNLALNANWFLGHKNKYDLISQDANFSSLSDLGVTNDDFVQFRLLYEQNYKLKQKSSLFTKLQGGYNTNRSSAFFNKFNIGGFNSFLRNQISFSGLSEYDLSSSSVLTLGFGWNYNIWSEFYLSAIVNAGLYDFDVVNILDFKTTNFVTGAGLSAGYLTPVGPVKISISYSPQTNNVVGSLNLGWSF